METLNVIVGRAPTFEEENCNSHYERSKGDGYNGTLIHKIDRESLKEENTNRQENVKKWISIDARKNRAEEKFVEQVKRLYVASNNGRRTNEKVWWDLEVETFKMT